MLDADKERRARQATSEPTGPRRGDARAGPSHPAPHHALNGTRVTLQAPRASRGAASSVRKCARTIRIGARGSGARQRRVFRCETDPVHHSIANALSRGVIRYIITTNYDCAIEAAIDLVLFEIVSKLNPTPSICAPGALQFISAGTRADLVLTLPRAPLHEELSSSRSNNGYFLDLFPPRGRRKSGTSATATHTKKKEKKRKNPKKTKKREERNPTKKKKNQQKQIRRYGEKGTNNTIG
ncbi:MAG: hypothetical protein U5K74_09650 [Gemmatimonadaceae bacterium]|nr:hypothetical protein [Gemmatimonadaceae bacterium]